MARRDVIVGVAAVLLLLGAAGCATTQDYGSGNLVRVGYRIADTLLANNTTPLGPQDPVIVASFVNVNNLQQSSSFGRMLAEQIASRFAQSGKRVIEMKLRQTSVFVAEGKGEFMLSRDVKEISKEHNASAVVVGTYTAAWNTVYVSARIVRPTDSVIVSTADVAVPMFRDQMDALIR
jgi:TolB-like protein